MQKVKTKRQIIHIISCGRSGSTMLDLTIGKHSQAFSLGEIMDFKTHYNLNRNCTCGKKLKDCQFWEKKIIENKYINNQKKFLLNFSSRFQRYGITIFNLFFGLLTFNRYKTLIKPICLKNNNEFYSKVFEKSGKPVLIDSSKSVLRAFLLYNSMNYNQKIIYLVKDARSYIYSIAHKSQLTSTKKATIKWLTTNLLALFFFKMIKSKDRLFIRYEDFASNPKEYIGKIQDFINLKRETILDEDNFFIATSSSHLIGGNQTRYSLKNIIKPNNKWKDTFTTKHFRIYKKYAKKMNKYFGYN